MIFPVVTTLWLGSNTSVNQKSTLFLDDDEYIQSFVILMFIMLVLIMMMLQVMKFTVINPCMYKYRRVMMEVAVIMMLIFVNMIMVVRTVL